MLLFILVNGKALATIDTLGVAMIPTNKLVDKETISVRYLGTVSGRGFIYAWSGCKPKNTINCK